MEEYIRIINEIRNMDKHIFYDLLLYANMDNKHILRNIFTQSQIKEFITSLTFFDKQFYCRLNSNCPFNNVLHNLRNRLEKYQIQEIQNIKNEIITEIQNKQNIIEYDYDIIK